MTELSKIAPAFVEMAHRIVWCGAATVDREGRPRTRILHPLWHWDGSVLSGVIASSPTPTKRAHLEASPFISLNYWAPTRHVRRRVPRQLGIRRCHARAGLERIQGGASAGRLRSSARPAMGGRTDVACVRGAQAQAVAAARNARQHDAWGRR